MADVIVPNEVPSIIVVAVTNGQVAFDYDFRADLVTDLKAELRPVNGDPFVEFVGGTDFIASGLGTAAGGTIALTGFTGTKVGDSLAIYRDIPIERQNDYSRDLFADDLNAEQDRVFMIMQELQRDIDRAVKSGIGTDPIKITKGDPGDMVAFDDDGNLIPIDPPSGVGNMNTATYDPQGMGSDAFDPKNWGDYDLHADFLAANVPAGVTFVRTAGFYSIGKGGGTWRSISAPVSPQLYQVQSANGRWWELFGPRIDSDMLGAVGDGVTDTKAVLQAVVDLAVLLGVRSYFNNGTYNAAGIDTPNNCIIEWAPNAWIRPLTYSPPGAVICNKIFPAIERPYARTNITLINPQVDGTALAFTGPGPQMNDNGIGFATGVTKVRVYGGHVTGYRANFEDGPGGKGFGVEQGVSDVIVWGLKVTNCTYATFVSSHIFDDTKLAWDISFHDLHIERCANIGFLLGHDPNPGATPTTNARKCSAAYYGVTAYDCGHSPDRNTADYRQKSGAIVAQGFSNLIMRGIKISNSPGYPNATYPAGGTAFPTGWPALGETRVGAGMTGTGIGAVIWGWGRNWNLDIDFNGECDDIWNIQRPQAHSSVNMGTSVAPNSVFGMAIKVVYRGSTKGLINSGAIGTTGTLTAGTATTVTFPVNVNLPTRDEGLAGVPLAITGGTGSGQSKRISTYNATTRVATIEGTFSPVPDATSTFSLGSTRAIADAEINGFIEIVSDNPSISLVSNLARFPTNIKLIARSSSDLTIGASFLDVFNFNNTFSAGATVRGFLYTPAVANVLNVSGAASFPAKVIRTDKVVQVSGLVTFTAAAGGACEVELDLPLASNLTISSQAIGVCSNNGGQSGTVISNTTNKKAKIQYPAAGAGAQTVAYSYMYDIT